MSSISRGALLPCAGDEVALFDAAYAEPHAGHAEGPDRLRQDPLYRAHGLAARRGR